jgi:antagonist of KipI
MTLTVLEPGLYSLVVDAGRPASRSLGVPPGGAADRAALALGNALVGNPPDAAGLEISLAGPTLRADCDLGAVVFGAPFRLTHDRPRTVGTTFTWRAGEVLRIGGTPVGARAYLCLAGGLDEPVRLGSRSGLGPVAAGAVLACSPGRAPARRLPEEVTAAWTAPPAVVVLRALDGPQADWFAPGQFWGKPWAVQVASNRMGLRLDGGPMDRPGRELTSEPVAPGAVQVTNDGRCIVLGVDGQTIGGYPKVAHVIAADLDRLGRLGPGTPVRFERVTLEEAERFDTERRAILAEWARRLRLAAW